MKLLLMHQRFRDELWKFEHNGTMIEQDVHNAMQALTSAPTEEWLAPILMYAAVSIGAAGLVPRNAKQRTLLKRTKHGLKMVSHIYASTEGAMADLQKGVTVSKYMDVEDVCDYMQRCMRSVRLGQPRTLMLNCAVWIAGTQLKGARHLERHLKEVQRRLRLMEAFEEESDSIAIIA